MKYQYQKHKAIKVKFMSYLMCEYCGLVYLNNDFTRWSIKKGCNHENHPEYKKQFRLTGTHKK